MLPLVKQLHVLLALLTLLSFSLRGIYLLGVFRWALGDVPLSCLLETVDSEAECLEEDLHRARRAGALAAPAEMVRWDGGERGLGGLLQAVLARADAARRAPRGGGSLPAPSAGCGPGAATPSEPRRETSGG